MAGRGDVAGSKDLMDRNDYIVEDDHDMWNVSSIQVGIVLLSLGGKFS